MGVWDVTDKPQDLLELQPTLLSPTAHDSGPSRGLTKVLTSPNKTVACPTSSIIGRLTRRQAQKNTPMHAGHHLCGSKNFLSAGLFQRLAKRAREPNS